MMFATKDISDVIRGHQCCYMENSPACDYCPYYDEMDGLSCVHRLTNDISYFLDKAKKAEKPTEEEQPFLPGLEKEFDLSSVKFTNGDYIMLNGIKLTYICDEQHPFGDIKADGQIS